MNRAEVLALACEVSRVMRALPSVERGLRAEGPAPLVARLRERGALAKPRNAEAQIRLRRAIFWIDRLVPGGGACYRRALLEIALDPDAARAPFRMGLCVADGKAAGHAWLGDADLERYDVNMTL
jgi:hypothetical protein